MCPLRLWFRLAAAMTASTRTLLFSDIVASTELAIGIGESQADVVRRSHFATFRRQIDRHHGRLVKNLGDGAMAEFHAARPAIECAVAIQISTAHESTTVGRRPLSIRVGVSSGDIHLEDGDCFGIPVVEASRLCAHAKPGQVVIAESTRLLARGYEPLAHIGPISLKGLPEPTVAWEATWSAGEPALVRAVLADDSTLVREGIARVLEHHGIEVLAQASDAAELLRLTAELRPDIAIVDVRMPPTHTIEGVDAAVQIRNTHADTGVLLLSQDVEPTYAARLLAASPTAVGYLLKERVTDIREFANAARRVAAGGVAFEAAVTPERIEVTR
jgi:class 3 adenylate cyclase/CheY-like chemotaxis protein